MDGTFWCSIAVCILLFSDNHFTWWNSRFSRLWSFEQSFHSLIRITMAFFYCFNVGVNHTFALSHGVVANALQAKHVDLRNCVTMSENLIKDLTVTRENFQPIYKEAENLAAEIGATLSIPRRVERQTLRANFDTEDCCKYYKLSIFLPFLDYFMSQLYKRFLKHKRILQNIKVFLPFQVSDESLWFWNNKSNRRDDAAMTWWHHFNRSRI